MAWEQDAESWKVVGKNMFPRNSIVFHFEIMREKQRGARPGYECNPGRGSAALGRAAVDILEICLVGVPQNDHPTGPCKAGSPGHCTEAAN